MNGCCGAQVSLEQAQAHGPSHMLPATYANPLGRASISRPTAAQFERASVVRAGCVPGRAAPCSIGGVPVVFYMGVSVVHL